MSANLEPAAISSLTAWKTAQRAEIKQREEALAAQLRAAVPKSLSTWGKEETVIDNLVEYGRATRKYHSEASDGGSYGYTNLKEFARRFKKLKVAWKGVVEFSISWDNDDCFHVRFLAI